ncbi:helix-turn-helix transcriptional regulator [Sciscionella sediminilitoris]|uniref:helix-turn-helix transcriptional regulator n=1 Tax=Sciscionella sediminilitoris TaxID=1445613 RepID=UPI0004DF7D0B|nr:WYL domain-containing protein [Sciscionella sp. SE31]
MTATSDRVPRLLALVPYFLARPGIELAEAARDFDVTPRQLRRDLELLWMCGLPGYGPGDLIDLSFEGDTVTVTFDAGIRRPLKLTAAEATALLVALRALAETPGVTDTDAVRRALAKIETAAGGAEAPVVVGLTETRGVDEQVRATVREGLDAGRALWIRYYTVARDEISDRTVDPMRLLLVEGRSYLEAWCRSAEGVRLFRLDRIDEVRVLDEASAPPADAEPTDLSDGLFRPNPAQPVATLLIGPEARWVAEYYPVEDLVELEDGSARVRMRYADESWMVRLLLSVAGDVRVEAPEQLAAAVVRRAGEALELAELESVR